MVYSTRSNRVTFHMCKYTTEVQLCGINADVDVINIEHIIGKCVIIVTMLLLLKMSDNHNIIHCQQALNLSHSFLDRRKRFLLQHTRISTIVESLRLSQQSDRFAAIYRTEAVHDRFCTTNHKIVAWLNACACMTLFDKYLSTRYRL